MPVKPPKYSDDQILFTIQEFIKQHRYSPCIRDIMRAVNISSTSVTVYYLDALQRRGFLERDPEINRSIILTDMGVERAGTYLQKIQAKMKARPSQ
jgi:repressor LexA